MCSSDHDNGLDDGRSVTQLLATLTALAQVDPAGLTQAQAHAELLGLQRSWWLIQARG